MIPATLVKHKFTAIALCTAYLLIIVIFLRDYLLWNLTSVVSILLLPYIAVKNKIQLSQRYFYPTLLLCCLAFVIPVKTLFFFAILFSLLLLTENYIGKMNYLVLFLFLFISPVFQYISSVIAFPIRLWLSETTAYILTNIFGIETIANGNIITQQNVEFSVDQACAGLNMLAISFILCLFIIAHHQKKHESHFSFPAICLLMAITFILNIISNLFRIVLLVMFKIMPGNIFHDLTGILCLSLYVLLPLLCFAKYFSKKKSETGNIKVPLYTSKSGVLLPHISLLIMLIIIALNLKSADELNHKPVIAEIKGYSKNILENGILKLENEESLIYIKPVSFYAPEHNPMICWKGSGYDFQAIKTENISGKKVYTGLLVKDKDKIYSSWWFESKDIQTINQFDWRWDSLRNQNRFYLVNVSAASYPTLLKTIENLHSEKSLITQ